ncbi:MAG: ABC transporter ATP-binding protein [Spirochaetales bacterium]|nr:ABC transporter ATP-binding protein [Spirochaetales bacterium]
MNTKSKSPNGLMSFAAAHSGAYAASVIFAILGVGCQLVPYFAVSKLVIGLITGVREPAFFIRWCVIAAAFFFGKQLFHSVSTTISHKTTFRVISEIRYKIADKLSKTPMGYVLDTPSGKLKNIIVEKVDGIEPTLAHMLPELTSNILGPLSIIIYLFTIDWRMALISLITLPIGYACLMGMMKDYDKKFKIYIDAQKHVNSVSVEYINGIEVIKAFNQSASSYKKFTDAVKKNANYALDWMHDLQIWFALGYGIWPAVLITVLPLGSLFIINGSLAIPDFITIIILSLGIIGPILAAINFIDDIAKIKSIFTDIQNVLDEPEMQRPEKGPKLTGTEICLKDVSFSYHKTTVLKGINLNIPAKSVTALVGPSGGGKSTIAKLIASLWDVSEGEITIGGVNVKDVPFNELMNNIAYVSQDNYLFDDTIRNNIRMGKPSATDAEVEEAAKASGCHDFIMQLQNGYETVAGGAGGHLSGGERQRITIARAMLKNSSIIILDEATAYTDPENEAVIQKAVAGLVKDKTLIVIAHRLSTITGSDKIVVIEKGKVKAEGRHEELLENCALYNSMWRSHMEIKDEKLAGEITC